MSPHHHEGYKGPTHPQEVDASVSINIEGVRKKLLEIVGTNDQLEYMEDLLTDHGVDHLSTVIWNLHFIIPHDLFLAYKELRNNFFQHFIPTYEAYYNRPYMVQWRGENTQLNQEIENALEPTIGTNKAGWDHPDLADRVKKIILKKAGYEEVSDETLATFWSEFIQRKGGNTERRTGESVTFTENLDTEILKKLYQAYHDIMLANPEMLNSTLLT